MDANDLPKPRMGTHPLWDPSEMPPEIRVTSRFVTEGAPAVGLTDAERLAILKQFHAGTLAAIKLEPVFDARWTRSAADLLWDATDLSAEAWYDKALTLDIPGAPAPVAVLNGYVVLRRMSEGTFAVVFLGYDPWNGVPVALKVPKDLAQARVPSVLEELEHEVSLLSLLRHRNIVRLARFGCDFPRGVPVIATELVLGPSLQRVISACIGPGKPGLRASQLYRITRQLALAMEHLHANRVVHGDFKPGNVRIDRSTGRLVVLDLGAGCLMRAAGDDRALGSRGLTPVYSSPPRLLDAKHAPSAADDVYALSATASDVVCGLPSALVRAGRDALAVSGASLRVEYLLHVAPRAAMPLVEILVRGLRGELTTATEFLAELKRIHDAGFGA